MLSKFLDTYERNARLYPALLVLAPIFACLIAELVSLEKRVPALIGIIGAFGGLYLAASVVREYGKRLESRLVKKWGGLPTTQFLRHRSSDLDPVTKSRYHLFLGKHIGITFPTLEDERNSPDGADAVYQSAVRWLLEKTRDTKQFSLLYKENIAYGFRRNGMAVRYAGIGACIMSATYLVLSAKVIGFCYVDFESFTSMGAGQLTALVLCAALLAIWVTFFNEETVRGAANTYAKTLLASCDTLPKKR